MAVQDYFLTLLMVFLAARLFSELADRLQAPAVIGELLVGVLLVGVLLGPSGLGWIEPSEAIKLLAEIGIIMLLFEVGLETDIKRLLKTGLQAFIVAFAGLNLPFVLGIAVAYWYFGLSLLTALFIGGTLTATSIGITLRVLTDLKRRDSTEGQIVLGAAVLDDIPGVVLLALLYEFSLDGRVDLVNAGEVLASVLSFFVLAPFAAKGLSLIIVMLGLSLNLRDIDWHSPFVWSFSAAIFAVAVIGKLFSALFIRAACRQRWAIGLAMVPRGEIGLVFAELGKQSRIFNDEIYAGMIIVIALTTLFPPFVLKWNYARFGSADDEASSDAI